MNEQTIMELLESVSSGTLDPHQALEQLRSLPFDDMGFAKVDLHRLLRKGYPETIFCQGKTPEQVADIAQRMREHKQNVLGTRCSTQTFDVVKKKMSDAVYHEMARAFTLMATPPETSGENVAIVCAGTGDIFVAEEAAVTCMMLGVPVERIYDVGVAGLHRLLHQREHLMKARVVIVCAGMEGALPSVVAGLCPGLTIAVPTSVGYGASFNGIAALLGMLNSCATGLTVVNIDNGFGAAVAACTVCRMVDGAQRL